MSATIASTAMRYKGKVPYVWGGHSPAGWDCSGFVGYVLGHDLGMGLPLGSVWSAGAHGPVAASYKTWVRGSTAVKAPAAGDLCCWLTHVGIYIGNGQMISALDPQWGTKVSPVSWGPKGEPLSYRRVKDAPGGTLTSVPAPGQQITVGAGGCIPGMIMMPLLLSSGLLAHLRRPGDHHRRPDALGHDQDVVGGQLVDDGGGLLPVPAHRLRDSLDHVPVPGGEQAGKRGLPGGVLTDPGGGLETGDDA